MKQNKQKLAFGMFLLVYLMAMAISAGYSQELREIDTKTGNSLNSISTWEEEIKENPDSTNLGLPDGATTGNTIFDRYIVQAAQKFTLDPLLLLAQMKQESGFKLRAKSHKGASGLMQLMPDTAKRFGVKNIYDPKQNIFAGAKYMRWLLDKFEGDLELALAGYNAGEGAVIKYGYNIPPYRETQDYVRRIKTHYNELKETL